MMRSIIGSSLRFRPLVIGYAAAALILVFSASACAGANPDRVTGGSNTKPEQATAKDFDPNRFDRSPNIDNKWLPEKPGTQFVYEGSAISDEGSGNHHHRPDKGDRRRAHRGHLGQGLRRRPAG